LIDFWRDLDTGPNPPGEVYAVVETPKGNENKYEYDVVKKAIVLDRVLYSAMHYPGDYGLIPRTLDEDGDPLDVLVLVTNPTFPGCVLTVRPIGLLRMLDGEARDDKILSVPIDDVRYAKVRDLTDVQEHILKEIAHLFETYKVLEGKTTKILDWSNAEEAKATIHRSQELYTRKIP
jgi:inorganic pyrophosphatase